MSDANPVSDELAVHNGEPERPTFTDSNGVERIAGPPVENWQPAQVEPTDAQIARNKAFQAQSGAVTDSTVADVATDPAPVPDAAPVPYGTSVDAVPVSVPVIDVPVPPAPGQTDQQVTEAAAAAAADAEVAAQVEAERAAAAEAQAQADAAALAAAETKQVTDEEATS